MSFLSCLQCSYCSAEYDAQKIWNLCPACGKPLLARYDLLSASRQFSKSALKERVNSLWRDSEIMDSANQIGRSEGLFVSPETGATFAALRKLINSNSVKESEKVVLFNTGSGYKYMKLWADDE